MKYLLLFHGNNGYTNVPQCHIYMYIACLVKIKTELIFHSMPSNYEDSCLRAWPVICLTLLASWVPSLDMFSSSLRICGFEEAGTDEDVTVDVDWRDADGAAEVWTFPLSPCCCSMHRIIVIRILLETAHSSLCWNYSLRHTWRDY
jgi:hypothetical protein